MAKKISSKSVSATTTTVAVKFWQRKSFSGWLVFGFAFLLFANSITGQYNMDDELVTINHRLTSKGISAIPEIFSSPYYQDESGYSYEYRPLVLASFAFEHQLFGDNPHVSHLINVLLYSLCCLVLFQALLKLFRSYSPLLSLIIALLFAAHPAHTEVVCSIKNRDEILSLLFGLLTLTVTLNGVQSFRKWWLVLTPLMFTLALLGKTTIISFVVIIPLALILFSSASFGLILFITFLLVVPSYFFLQLNPGIYKIFLFTCVMAVVSVIYSIVNWQTFTLALRRISSAFLGGLFANNTNLNYKPEVEENKFNIKLIFKGIGVSRQMFSVFAIGITVVLVFFYLFSIAQGHSLLGIVPLGLLILLACWGNESVSYCAFIGLGLALCCNVIFNRDSINSILISPYLDLVAYYFVFQIYFSKKKFFIPFLALFILLAFIAGYDYKKYDLIFVLPLVLINYRFSLYLLLIFLYASVGALYPFPSMHDKIEIVKAVAITIVATLLYFKRGLRPLHWGLLISAACMFHIMQYNTDKDLQAPVKKAMVNVTDVANSINPVVITLPENRPLLYVEECIDQSTPTTIKMGTSFKILFRYMCQVVIPYPLSFYYGYKTISPMPVTSFIPVISLIVHLALFILALVLIRSHRLISFGLLAYFISVTVFSNYFQLIAGMYADRFLLIPSLGWSVLLAVILQKIFKVDISGKTYNWSSVPLYAKYVFGSILLLYGSMSFARNLDWHDDLKLMRHDINVVPESAQAHNLLAIHLVKNSFNMNNADEQKLTREEALEHLKIANSLYPGFFNYIYDVGRIYVLLNMPDSAVIYFKRAYVINPDYIDAAQTIADIYIGKNDFKSAIPYLVILISKKPGNYALYSKLSYAYFKNNQRQLSIQTNLDAIRQFPALPDPYVNIANCYVDSNKDSTRIWLKRGLAISPANNFILDYLKRIDK